MHNITNYSNVGMTIFNNIHMLTAKKFKRLGRSHIIAVICEKQTKLLLYHSTTYCIYDSL